MCDIFSLIVVLSGSFGENIVEDFFGFKEIGLDKEHDNLKIPMELWYANDQDKWKAYVESKTSQHYKYPIPPRFQPITNSQSFIGLLQPWYDKRIHDHPNMLEDEYTRRTHRPVPPIQTRYTNSKLIVINKSMVRKRVLKDGSNLHTKPPQKRKKMDEETKAEKKKQRLELKAQKKQAEKEQKKKQREELKLAKQKKSTQPPDPEPVALPP